jgi:uncharacterized ubiquitin-like protein YukD
MKSDFQVFVKVNNHGRTLSMDVSPDINVMDLKKKVCDCSMIPRTGEKHDPNHVELLCQGNVLESNKTLSEIGIASGDMLELFDPIEAD